MTEIIDGLGLARVGSGDELGPGAWSSAYNAANLDVCKCYGALSYLDNAKARILKTSRPQLWLLKSLIESHDRMTAVLHTLIRRRDELWKESG